MGSSVSSLPLRAASHVSRSAADMAPKRLAHRTTATSCRGCSRTSRPIATRITLCAASVSPSVGDVVFARCTMWSRAAETAMTSSRLTAACCWMSAATSAIVPSCLTTSASRSGRPSGCVLPAWPWGRRCRGLLPSPAAGLPLLLQAVCGLGAPLGLPHQPLHARHCGLVVDAERLYLYIKDLRPSSSASIKPRPLIR